MDRRREGCRRGWGALGGAGIELHWCGNSGGGAGCTERGGDTQGWVRGVRCLGTRGARWAVRVLGGGQWCGCWAAPCVGCHVCCAVGSLGGLRPLGAVWADPPPQAPLSPPPQTPLTSQPGHVSTHSHKQGVPAAAPHAACSHSFTSCPPGVPLSCCRLSPCHGCTLCPSIPVLLSVCPSPGQNRSEVSKHPLAPPRTPIPRVKH